ncbi:MAG TPA: Uma2 family endonuclease [Polyangiaceae bacterium]|nr:Uma2 family endonuclease [Polyangiaceae bacterium]
MASAALSEEDRTVYPEEERVGEDILQRFMMELFRPLLERYLREQGQACFVGADQFIYYRQFDAHARIAPDIYVLPGVAPGTEVRSWKVWQTGIVPSFALEITSLDWEKDYVDAPVHHAKLGTQELIVFDPHHGRRGEGVRFQRFARQGGAFKLAEHTDADRIRSEALGCWLCAVGRGQEQRLRIASLSASTVLYPTAEEAERQAKEAERQAKEAALARVAELEAMLERRSK